MKEILLSLLINCEKTIGYMLKLDIKRQIGVMMTFLEALLLWTLKKLRSERTVYSVFHLLKGKKSSQSIQDAYLYQVGPIFYTFPNLTRKSFDFAVQSLVNQSCLMVKSDHTYQLSNQGERQLEEYFKKQPFPAFLNGMKYQDSTIIFWNRLVILIQVLSNLVNLNRYYYPVTRDPDLLRWVKKFIKSRSTSMHQLSSNLLEELYQMFSNHPPENPDIFVIRLTGYKQIGKTIEQAADLLDIESTEYWYRYLNLLHFVMEEVLEKPKTFPLLHSIIQDTYKPFPLTKSTFETYELLLKNYSISDISKRRKLKENTIQDHIIEIALNDSKFSILPFIDKNTEEKILMTAKKVGKQKLKPIKDHLDNVTYFQIRLTLAKNRWT